MNTLLAIIIILISGSDKCDTKNYINGFIIFIIIIFLILGLLTSAFRGKFSYFWFKFD